MNVGRLIQELEALPADLEVWVFDCSSGGGEPNLLGSVEVKDHAGDGVVYLLGVDIPWIHPLLR